MTTEEKTAEVSGEIKCKDCGGLLKFAPGTNSLSCQYCGAKNEIAASTEKIVVEEIDFEKFLSDTNLPSGDKKEVTTVKCSSCGASTTLKENVSSDNCPFCDTALVIKGGTVCTVVKPKYVLPFFIDAKKGGGLFKSWIDGLWFAPNDLKKYADSTEKLKGMYIPYWTYDSKTTSQYTGSRGDNYTVQESYTYTSNGKTQTGTRSVTKIRWTPAWGTVYNDFDDVLVLASKSLPEKHTYALEPWDLKKLAEYDDKYLSGFQTEVYQVDVKQGFEKGKTIMAVAITTTVKQNIGGDHQRVDSVNTNYRDITFKHILLPIWISAYRYNSKVYRFLINGNTGEVQGERPYSAIKITLAVLGGLALIAAGVYLYMQYGNR